MKQSNTAIDIAQHSYELPHNYHINQPPDKRYEHKIHSLPFNFKEASDESLVDLYTNRQNEEAFNEIVARYNDIITGFAQKLCRHSYDAEDIKQDVLLILATKLQTFKYNSKFSTWLYRVTLNTCYKYLNDSNKRTKKELTIDESLATQYPNSPYWSKTPDEMLLNKERMDIIGRAAEELNKDNQEIFNLKDVNGFSNAEVAEFTGLSISAVKSRVLRTRLALREKISNYI